MPRITISLNEGPNRSERRTKEPKNLFGYHTRKQVIPKTRTFDAWGDPIYSKEMKVIYHLVRKPMAMAMAMAMVNK